MPVARIQSITELWVQIIRLELEGGFEDGFRFAAGQYLEIEHPSGVGIPLSIASAPHRLPQLELHYRATPGDALAPLFDDLLEVGGGLELRGPFGDVIVTSPTAPLLLAAGGTGISQALGIIEHIQHLASRPAVTLLWCVESADALYARAPRGPALARCPLHRRRTQDAGQRWPGVARPTPELEGIRSRVAVWGSGVRLRGRRSSRGPKTGRGARIRRVRLQPQGMRWVTAAPAG